MKRVALALLAVVLLVSTALPLLAEEAAPAAAPAAQVAAPAELPAWLAPAADAGLSFLLQPIPLCASRDQVICNHLCQQRCSPCQSSGNTCTDSQCLCGPCVC
jgi:hypothetical protein